MKTMRITQELPHWNHPLCEKAKTIQTVQIHMENISFPLSVSEMKKKPSQFNTNFSVIHNWANKIFKGWLSIYISHNKSIPYSCVFLYGKEIIIKSPQGIGKEGNNWKGAA